MSKEYLVVANHSHRHASLESALAEARDIADKQGCDVEVAQLVERIKTPQKPKGGVA